MKFVVLMVKTLSQNKQHANRLLIFAWDAQRSGRPILYQVDEIFQNTDKRRYIASRDDVAEVNVDQFRTIVM